MVRYRLAAILATLAGACADLPALKSGVCGNSVLEAEEDCDTFVDDSLGERLLCAPPSDTTRACRYVCVDDTLCPTGWACGEEGICRYATGCYLDEGNRALRLSADSVTLGDFDGDDRVDVLARSGPFLDLVYGAGIGANIGERLNVRFEYEKYDLERTDDADALWLTAAWKF